MPSFETTRRVLFTPRQMFDLVADVEQYPKFLPLCEGLRVRSRSLAGDVETIIADMNVGYCVSSSLEYDVESAVNARFPAAFFEVLAL